MITLDTMKAYSDTTKTFIQLSSGALVLPLAIRTQVLTLFRVVGLMDLLRWVHSGRSEICDARIDGGVWSRVIGSTDKW